MKTKIKTIKWFIGIALLNVQIVAYSQNFIDDNKEWAIVSTYTIKNENLYQYWTTYYKFMGDSTINGFTYHKLYSSTDSSQVNWIIDSYWWERNDSVFVRFQNYGNINDTTNLLYDFNIEEGDTFYVDADFNMKVDSIRYLEFGGTIKKYWYFNRQSTYGYLFWIEDVGEWGNFYRPVDYCSSTASQILCFHENDSLVYQNPNFSSCYVYTNAPSIAKSNERINLFPNPATTQLNFTIPENSINATYTLYDMQGISQLTGKASNSQTEINVSTLLRGLYILKIVTDKQTITKKVVLQ